MITEGLMPSAPGTLPLVTRVRGMAACQRGHGPAALTAFASSVPYA